MLFSGAILNDVLRLMVDPVRSAAGAGLIKKFEKIFKNDLKRSWMMIY